MRYGRIIHDEAKRLTRLLDDLLDLSVLENGAVQLSLGLASLQGMIDTALTAARATRPEREFQVVRDLPSETIYLKTDADRLAQVFINLISNARKYCDAPRPELRITVRCRRTRNPHCRSSARGAGHGGFHRQRQGHPAGEPGADLREVLSPDRCQPRRGRRAGPGDLPRDHDQSRGGGRLYAGAGRRGLSGDGALAAGAAGGLKLRG